jgi:hypothetical protein
MVTHARSLVRSVSRAGRCNNALTPAGTRPVTLSCRPKGLEMPGHMTLPAYAVRIENLSHPGAADKDMAISLRR